ncbi:MAG: hypothetical protein KAT25_04475 [Sulfuriflexus sp.]|nr:hypothetical protein [Sulfuriflexus sp.]
MSNVIPFRKPSLKEKHRGNTLCRNNLHKWIIVNERRFDTKQGQLVTEFKCSRCGKTRTKTI